MKAKLTFAVTLLLVALMGRAQNIGIKGGINISTMKISALGLGVAQKSLVGMHVGPVADFQILHNLYFNTGLLYSLKGFREEFTDPGSTESLNYLVIPINIACKVPVSDHSRVRILAGPYLGYALSGKDKSGGESTDIEFGPDGMKRFDYGIGIGAGVEFGSVVTSLNYEHGLARLIDDN